MNMETMKYEFAAEILRAAKNRKVSAEDVKGAIEILHRDLNPNISPLAAGTVNEQYDSEIVEVKGITVEIPEPIKSQTAMEEAKKIPVVSKIVGALVNHELSALDALEILDIVRQTYLERSWHISVNKKAD